MNGLVNWERVRNQPLTVFNAHVQSALSEREISARMFWLGWCPPNRTRYSRCHQDTRTAFDVVEPGKNAVSQGSLGRVGRHGPAHHLRGYSIGARIDRNTLPSAWFPSSGAFSPFGSTALITPSKQTSAGLLLTQTPTIYSRWEERCDAADMDVTTQH